ncbi:MAG: hypothetical protein QF415_10380 [Candidatus Undinarchaeales archaeon]|jgi:hypothetical protein|nr:hypothetical protein [Candidatus Undinarchaeales archaeon]MDP7494401.1 hypothetical protein [Candidatus Undinarchaeales archaeon]
MLTKTQLKILKLFASQIGERLSIKQVSEELEKPYPLIHRSIQGLLDQGFLVKDKQNYLSLDHRMNHFALCYAEGLRKRDFLESNRTVGLFVNDILERLSTDFFILLFFGSVVGNAKRPRDVDVLVIIEDEGSVGPLEKTMYNIADAFSVPFDITVLPVTSMIEMLKNRDELNVMNESLTNHVIVFGAENYYRVLSHAR